MRRKYVAGGRILAVALTSATLLTQPAQAEALSAQGDVLSRPDLAIAGIFRLVGRIETNPILGIAAGAYANIEASITRRLGLAVGVTSRRLERDLRGLGTIEQVAFGRVKPFAADARQFSVSYRAGRDVRLNAAFTRLRARSSLLAMQPLDALDLAGAPKTEGVTLGADMALGRTVHLWTSGTLGRTRQAGAGHTLGIGGGGLITSSFEATLTKVRLFGRSDQARLSLAQPMFVESGSVDPTGVEVIDRRTGALAQVTRSFDTVSGSRQYVTELLYGRSLAGGAAELSLFGRARLAPDADRRTAAVMGGGRMRLTF